MHSPVTEWPQRARPITRSLVLFVGHGARPPLELGEGLLRDGVRGLWIESVSQALAAAAHARFDAAVFRLDGSVSASARQFDAWRQALGCPLMLLVDTLDEVDEIMALELGADVVLAQPVSARRLRAHLLMLLRRGACEPRQAHEVPVAEPPSVASVAGWQLDRVHNRLSKAGRHVELTEMQAALLQVLIDDLGRVVPRARLLAAVSLRRALQPRSVDVYVARLRLRLQAERVDELLLEGVRGRGYLISTRATPSASWSRPAMPQLDWGPPARSDALPARA